MGEDAGPSDRREQSDLSARRTRAVRCERTCSARVPGRKTKNPPHPLGTAGNQSFTRHEGWAGVCPDRENPTLASCVASTNRRLAPLAMAGFRLASVWWRFALKKE
ncbi:hypothetical protein MES4922_190256 [Mesorhizobium ventifaucium]|uniref:Uncharacterized protein n=1 Tax=Mesorhizobium ventifaucium TaxID=666020 RepID=A0ABN8JHD3_9HYPH|nr:hypothetical protein MES4922_190256 [Mesorhizobium ventifaucium]